MKLAVIASGEMYIQRLAEYLPRGIAELVVGKEDGICRSVRDCAAASGIPLTVFPSASDDLHLSGDVPLHHRQMIAYADELLLLWDGRDNAAEPIAVCAEKREMNIHLVIVEQKSLTP